MNVAKPGVTKAGDDAESDQRERLFGDNVEGSFETGLKRVDRLDDVICRDNGKDRILVALEQNRGGEADGVSRIAALGLAEEIFARQLREILENRRAMPLGRAHENLLRW